VVREKDGWLEKPGDCRTWRTRHYETGVAKGLKDYRLCPTDSDRLFVDEGDGVTVDGKLLGDVLVSPFEYERTLLFTQNRVWRKVGRGDHHLQRPARDQRGAVAPGLLDTESDTETGHSFESE
jgi:hypothetical protein